MTNIEKEYGFLTIHDYIKVLNEFGVEKETSELYLRRIIGYNFRSLSERLWEEVSENKTKGSIRKLNREFELLIERSNDIINPHLAEEKE